MSARSLLRGNRVIAILRESKNKWEQRAPLSPAHVEKLVKQGIKVLVQPSTRRAFYDAEYAKAGAIVQEDVSPASLIMGVKEVPIKDLMPERSYLFFSHVTKAQDYNMSMLDEIKAKNIRLFDYEHITETGERSSPRLVAFGRFAGIAGMIDTFRGLGERMLSLGYANPFMKVGSTYMYDSLETAEDAVRRTAQQIADNGSPPDLGPLVFTFTGTGAVSRGAQEIFNLLPVEWVTKHDLQHLCSKQNADLKKCYGVVAQPEDYIVPKNKSSGVFSKDHYYAEPHEYRSIFHETFLPYTSVLMNCMFWTQSFPRIVTDAHVRDLDLQRRLRLLAVSDISCDFEGSIECLKQFATIEDPFYMFDPQTGLVSNDLSSHGFLMHAVDTLPAQLPKEATNHFGEHLMPLLPNLVDSDGTKPVEEQKHDLNPSWYGAMITAHGDMAPNYHYVDDLRKSQARLSKMQERKTKTDSPSNTVRTLMLRGHLFDRGVFNRVLDVVEAVEGARLDVVDWQVGTSEAQTSTAVFNILGESGSAGEQIVADAKEKIEQVVQAMDLISPLVFRDITGLTVDLASSSSRRGILSQDDPPVVGCSGKSILVLGSGMVAGPAVDIMVKSGTSVTIASNDIEAAEALAAPHQVSAASPPAVVHLDMASGGADQLDELVQSHDIVVSLLPATMHTDVARLCLDHGRHFVSASYESEAMRGLDAQAKEAGLTFLNEMGLDPGIDHMSAMQIIDEAKANGEEVVSFTSLCGGLPAPDAANNPLGYKFSWNPAGVLQASQNSAQFLHCGQLKQVDGSHLMVSARSAVVGSAALKLEQLPNRDSLVYQKLYGLEGAHTVYRGTLRYQGFAPVVHALSCIGLFDTEKTLADHLEEAGIDGASATWADVMEALVGPAGDSRLEDTLRDRLEWDFFGSDSRENAAAAVSAFEYLGLFGKNASTDSVAEDVQSGATPRELLCKRLEERLSYQPGEADMVLLHHEFLIRSKDGKKTRRVTSTLQEYGKPYPDGPSAMAVTVGLPVGLGALLILNGTIDRRGVVLPLTQDIYDPVLKSLSELGVKCTEVEDTFSRL